MSLTKNPGDFVKLASFLFPIFFGIFLPFYYGNRVEFESEKLSASFFDSAWYDEEKDYKIYGKIFMEAMKKPIKLSIFKIFDVNLKTFGRICNATYSLFALFKHINNWIDSNLRKLLGYGAQLLRNNCQQRPNENHYIIMFRYHRIKNHR